MKNLISKAKENPMVTGGIAIVAGFLVLYIYNSMFSVYSKVKKAMNAEIERLRKDANWVTGMKQRAAEKQRTEFEQIVMDVIYGHLNGATTFAKINVNKSHFIRFLTDNKVEESRANTLVSELIP